MSDQYSTVVVGSDGSKSSMLAVERAAQIASAFSARLVIGCAYYETEAEADAVPRRDSVLIVGADVAQANLDRSAEYARTVGTCEVSTALRQGTPVQALMAIVKDVGADLLVVGNRGINSLTGRLLGSVPADVARQSDCDVMIVHTVN
ncbi:universal stress protein [Corynebacterium uterequi]|uniref:Universal stress protein UspA-like protein n=1 Tax=Corynebacterium uterequi TaxID=1072256 RepID=A0A0G3HGC1_9CORY|nr:universal stress protein [Corynebacterium uterequi]AKK10998.1 universal stress protein UspA-like protein [Corynebacterium uterequi]